MVLVRSNWLCLRLVCRGRDVSTIDVYRNIDLFVINEIRKSGKMFLKKLKYIVIAASILPQYGLADSDQYTVKNNVAPNAFVVSPLGVGGGAGYQGNHPYGYFYTEFPSMNDYGDVVGLTTEKTAAQWADGVLIDLGVVGCAEGVTICASRATSVNNKGVVVGSSNDDLNPFNRYFERAYSWIEQTAQPLSWYYGNTQSIAMSINERENVVGMGIDNLSYTLQSFIRYASGKTVLIGDAAYPSAAIAINEKNIATGFADFDNSSQPRAFIWSEANGIASLGTLGGATSKGLAIDDSEHARVVGYSYTNNQHKHAFIWQNGVMQDLGTLGGNASVARSINNAGDVVGYSVTDNNESHAFIWSNGQMLDLNDVVVSDWVIADAYHVTQQGHILALAVKDNESQYVILDSGNAWPERVTSGLTETVELDQLSSFGGQHREEVITAATDANNNYYSVGYSSSDSASFNQTETIEPYKYGVYLQKLSDTGQHEWTINISPTNPNRLGIMVTGLVVDNAGDIYVSGTVTGWTAIYDFDPGEGQVLFNNRTYSPKAFIAKYSPAGVLLRLDRFAGKYNRVFAKSIDVDAQGNLFAALYVHTRWAQYGIDLNPTEQQDIHVSTGLYVVKLTSDGDYQWSKQIGDDTGIGRLTAVLAASNDGFVVSGDTFGSVLFDGLLTSPDTADKGVGAFMVKYTIDGDLQWGEYLPNHQNATVKADTHGHFYLVSHGAHGVLLDKYDSLGNHVWTTPHLVAGTPLQTNAGMGSGHAPDYQVRYAVDGLGNVYIPGSFRGIVNFDAEGGKDFQTGGMFVSKFSADGQYAWTYSLDDNRGIGMAAVVDGAGSVYLAGMYENRLDAGEGLVLPEVTGFGKDVFIARFNQTSFPRITY